MSKYKAILFDNDGTVVDTEKAILSSFRHTMDVEFIGNDIATEDFKQYIGLPPHDQFLNYTKDEAKVESCIKTYRAHNDVILDDMSKNFDGLPEVLKQLTKNGYFLGIVTSKRHDICLHGLEVLGTAKYFKYLQGCDDWHEHKPDPGALTYACKQIGYKPSEVLYVGDSTFDIMSGNGAGCDTCAVLWGVFSREKLQEVNPTYIIEHPSKLLEIV